MAVTKKKKKVWGLILFVMFGWFLVRPSMAKNRQWFNINDPSRVVDGATSLKSISFLGAVEHVSGLKGQLNLAGNVINFEGGTVWNTK